MRWLALAFLSLFATDLHADCTNPPGVEGQKIYDDTLNVITFCDGAKWHMTGLSIPTAASAGCNNPSHPEGTIIYESNNNVAQFCNGENWVNMGPEAPSASGTSCSSPSGVEGTLTYNADAGWLQYCNGDDWVNAGVVQCPGCQNYPSAKLELDFTRGLAWL